MNCFDEFITEEELTKIEKYDLLYSLGVISLDNKKNRKFLDNYSYQEYLKKTNNEDNKGGASCE